MNKPVQLSELFEDLHFKNYPLVEIPQKFQDERGLIENIADGFLGDVAIITSISGSVRANHYHQKDWHLSYLVSGLMVYSWKTIDGADEGEIEIKPGHLLYTPVMTAHRMRFMKDSIFVAVSILSRNHKMYEYDTKRLDDDFFD